MDESIEAVMEMRNQDLILMKNEGILSQKGNQMSLINDFDEEQMQENINADGETRVALGEGKQQEIKGKLEEDTMLAKNIVKDHQFTMMIGTMEIAMETIETMSKNEGHLMKDVKKEETYVNDLTLGERTSEDLSITKEGMENCVKFPNSTPIEIIELYRKLDFQRRESEKQRIDVQERLLKKENKNIVMNENHKKKEMDMEVQQTNNEKEGYHYGGQEQRDIIGKMMWKRDQLTVS